MPSSPLSLEQLKHKADKLSREMHECPQPGQTRQYAHLLCTIRDLENPNWEKEEKDPDLEQQIFTACSWRVVPQEHGPPVWEPPTYELFNKSSRTLNSGTVCSTVCM